jgi:transcription elongation GreA/GreB family factor
MQTATGWLSGYNLTRRKKLVPAQVGTIVVLKIDGKHWAIQLVGDGPNAPTTTVPEVDGLRATVVPISASVGKALNGKSVGDPLWLVTAPGLPKPFGRRVKAKVIKII